MKFLKQFRFSKKGITFTYKGEGLTWSWMSWFHGEVYSHKYNTWFANFKYYKKYIDSFEDNSHKKLDSFEYIGIITEWVSMKYPFDYVIALININVEAKNVAFWAKIPTEDMKHFLKDAVLLRCKDESQLRRLVDNIPTEFAEAYGFSSGIEIVNNKEEI